VHTSRSRQFGTVVPAPYRSIISAGVGRRRALRLHKRDMAEPQAARLRECCPRNTDLIKVEELEAAD
jgi:hypothetical protein